MIKIKPGATIETTVEAPLETTDSVTFELQSNEPVHNSVEEDQEYNHPALRNPSEWFITPLSDDKITAYNNTTRHTFEGSISEFNEILRG